MNILLKYLAFLLVAAVIFSCNKTPTTPINTDVKANFSYQPGTYWIYRDTVSGAMDSLYVRANIRQDIKNANVPVESIIMYLTQYNLAVPTDTIPLRYSLSQSYLDTYLGTTVPYPFKVGPINTGGYGGTVLNVYGNYTVNGQTFANVAEVSHALIPSPYFLNDTFYICASAGIIKNITSQQIDTIVTNRVWELQRYHIVR